MSLKTQELADRINELNIAIRNAAGDEGLIQVLTAELNYLTRQLTEANETLTSGTLLKG